MSDPFAVKVGEEELRGRPFYPHDTKDRAQELLNVDWKGRYNELKNTRDWDPEKDFTGIKRLGDSYHPLDPFFKFDGVPKEHQMFDKVWWPMVGGVVGTISGVWANWVSRRPLVSNIITTIAVGMLGTGLGLLAYNNGQRRARERDAVLIHYLLIHENDFPRIERKRFGQLVKPWYPFRLGTDGLHVEE